MQGSGVSLQTDKGFKCADQGEIFQMCGPGGNISISKFTGNSEAQTSLWLQSITSYQEIPPSAPCVALPGQLSSFFLASSSYHDLEGRPGATDLYLEMRIKADGGDVAASAANARTIEAATAAVRTVI